MAEVKKHIDRIESTDTRVFALSADAPSRSAGFKKQMRLPFELLCDPEKKVVSLFDLINPHEHDGIAYPAIFVINPQGRIVYRSLDRTANRVQLDEVLAFLDKLKKNPSFEKVGGEQKVFIIPSLAEMSQIMQNMIFRGSPADWKHYFMFVFVYAPRHIIKSVTKVFR